MGLLETFFPTYMRGRQERLGALMARDEVQRQQRLETARQYVASIPAGSDITHFFFRTLDAPRYALFENQSTFRQEHSEVDSAGRTHSPFAFGFQAPPRRGPRTYFMGCTKEALESALADTRVADVFDTLNISFVMYPQWKRDLAMKGYFTIPGFS